MVQSDNERMVACGEDFLLCQSSLDLVALDHFFLGKHLQMLAFLVIIIEWYWVLPFIA